MYRFMSKQFIALFAGLFVLCSIQFISPPKMRGLILRRKTGTVSVEVFTFHVHLAFERHTGSKGREPLLSCSVYFVRIPLLCISPMYPKHMVHLLRYGLRVSQEWII